MLDPAFGGMCGVAKAVADGASPIGGGMADFSGPIGRSMSHIPCGVAGLSGRIFGAFLDVLRRLRLARVRRGAGECQCQCGKQEQVAFHDEVLLSGFT